MTDLPEFIPLSGIAIEPAALTLPRASQVAELLISGALNYSRLLECRVTKQEKLQEVLVVEVDVERPQKRAYDVHSKEVLAIIFEEEDSRVPETLSLRADFPRVPHLNLCPTELPRSLCLEERPWDDVRLDWTAQSHIEAVRSWLSRTARGTLHQPDQPLEPLMFGSGYHLVVPNTLFADIGDEATKRLHITLRGGEKARVLVAQPLDQARPENGGREFALINLVCGPVVHGVVWRTPATFKDLIELAEQSGVDLKTPLLTELNSLKIAGKELLEKQLVLVVSFLKQRDESSGIESSETKAFMTFSTVSEVGEALGCWSIFEGHAVPDLGGDDLKHNGAGIEIHILNVHRALTTNNAAFYNGLDHDETTPITAIGSGALGSMLQMNLARAGFGRWTLIDDDWMLPHNFARHELGGYAVGQSKAGALAFELNQLHEGDPIARSVHANLLHPKEDAESVEESLANAEVILDTAVSVPVSRRLAQHASEARRVSVFLNPTGNDLVVLAEDRDRQVRLDCLEMQYYRLLTQRAELGSHLAPPPGQVRYGLGCRDLSSRIPQDLLSVHAGIASRAVQQTLATNDASLTIWQIDSESMHVTSITAEPTEVVWRDYAGGWKVAIDRHVLQQVSGLRQDNLPDETGGILIGAYDMSSKFIYVVDATDAPPDSEKWPTLYIRGCEELPELVKGIETTTAGRLGYIGEWHSHPDGCPTLPSTDDVKVFTWLTEHMAADSKPALMLIAGENESSRLFLWQITEDTEELN